MPELTTFASRVPAPHIVGTVFDHEVTTSTEMLELANLANWDVRLREIETDARTSKKSFEVIRNNPFDGGLDRLGIAGARYGEVQNEQAFGLFDDLSPNWQAAGSFRDGALVYGQATTDQSIVIDPEGANDIIKPHIVISTTHDASGALNIGRTGMRLGCLNEFNAMFGNLQHSIKVRHTLTIVDRLKIIRRAWKTNNAYFDAMSAEANALFQQSITDKKFFDMVGTLMGDRPEENVKGAQTKYDNSLELYAQAWNGKPNENIKGTRWGAYQALIERNQWGRTIQNTDSGLENFAMAGIGFDIQTNNFRQKALELVKTF